MSVGLLFSRCDQLSLLGGAHLAGQEWVRDLTHIHGDVRERNLDALRVKRLLDPTSQLAADHPLLEWTGLHTDLDIDRRIREVVDPENLKFVQDKRTKIRIALSLSADLPKTSETRSVSSLYATPTSMTEYEKSFDMLESVVIAPFGITCTVPERSRSTTVRSLTDSTSPLVPSILTTSPT